MEQIKIAGKVKANKKESHPVPKKVGVADIVKSAEQRKTDIETELGITLTLDNSLSRFANEGFFVEHAKMVDEIFAKRKSNSRFIFFQLKTRVVYPFHEGLQVIRIVINCKVAINNKFF